MDSRDLDLFLSVARQGSTLAASKQLGISQSTVSRRIEVLEAELKLVLFEKLPSGYLLTDAGRALLPPAEEVERAMGKVLSLAEGQQRALAGCVRFTAVEVMGHTFLVPAMREFRAAYPDIRVELILSEAKLDLVAGEADVAIRSGASPDPTGLFVRRLSRDAWSVYCSRTYAAEFGYPRSVEELPAHHVIGLTKDGPRIPMVAWFENAVPDSAVFVRQHNVPGLFAGLRSGMGVTIMSDMVASTLDDVVQCFPLPPEAQADFSLWLVTPERLRHEPRVRALLDFLVGYFANSKYLASAQ